MNEMRALGFRRYGGPEVPEPTEAEKPEPADDGVPIRVAAAGVNPVLGKLSPRCLAPLRGGRRMGSVLVGPSGEDVRTPGSWISEGRVRPATDRRYGLEDAVEACRYGEGGRVRGKIVLVVDGRLADGVPSAPEERNERWEEAAGAVESVWEKHLPARARSEEGSV